MIWKTSCLSCKLVSLHRIMCRVSDVQVLSKALEVFGLSCTNVDNPACIEAAARPEQEQAFICNLRVGC